MNIIEKFKETAVSVLPVMGIVLLLGLTVIPLDKIILLRFMLGGLLLIAGLTIFLLGVDLGIQPMGERCGSELTKKRNLPLLLGSAFSIGFIVTAAEPDIQVFAEQVKGIYPFINKTVITFVIASGVGVFIMLGLLRAVTGFSIKITLLIGYLIVFTFTFLTPQSFTGIGFDSGGATTGPMTVPFIMALGLGVSSVRSKSDGSFGLTGVSSIGPVLAILFYGMILKANGSFEMQAAQSSVQTAQAAGTFGIIIKNVFHESLMSVLPLLGLFFIFQFTLLKMTKRQVIRILIGFLYAFVGLTVFLAGVNCGFMQAGAELGRQLGQKAAENGGRWFILLIGTGVVLGAIIVCAEPAVWVLSEQVEQVSGGTIKRKFLLIFLSVGTSIAIGLAMWRAVAVFSLKYFLIPGYAAALILMIFCPNMFSAIAFDSGGVASGPLTSTFILSFTLGAATNASGNSDSFGVIALVAMMPLIAIQAMGIIFKIKQGGKHV